MIEVVMINTENENKTPIVMKKDWAFIAGATSKDNNHANVSSFFSGKAKIKEVLPVISGMLHKLIEDMSDGNKEFKEYLLDLFIEDFIARDERFMEKILMSIIKEMKE